MDTYRGVTVFGETSEGKLSSITTDLLGGGRTLADRLREELSCLLFGHEVSGVAEEAIAYGADTVYVVEDAQLKDYQTDTYTPAAAELVQEIQPRILLFGQNDIGRDLAPRLAFRLGTGLSTDCIELDIDTEAMPSLQLCAKPYPRWQRCGARRCHRLSVTIQEKERS